MQAGYRYDRDLDKKFLKAKLKVRKLDKTSLGLYDSIEEDTISATVSKESKKPTNDTMSTQTDMANDTTTYAVQPGDTIRYASTPVQVNGALTKAKLDALNNQKAVEYNAGLARALISRNVNNPVAVATDASSVLSDASRVSSKASTVDPVQAKQQSLGSQLGSELSARLSQMSAGKKLSDLTKKKATESKSVDGAVVNNIPTTQSVAIPSNVTVPVLKAPVELEDKAQIPSGLAPLDTKSSSSSISSSRSNSPANASLAITDADTSMDVNLDSSVAASEGIANLKDVANPVGKPLSIIPDYGPDKLQEAIHSAAAGKFTIPLLETLYDQLYDGKFYVIIKTINDEFIKHNKLSNTEKDNGFVDGDNYVYKGHKNSWKIPKENKNTRSYHKDRMTRIIDADKAKAYAQQLFTQLANTKDGSQFVIPSNPLNRGASSLIGGTGMKRIGITAKRPRKGESLPMNSILLNQFDKGHLSVVTKKGNHVMTHKNMSPAFKRIVESIMKTGSFEASDYTQVTDKELPSVNQFIIQSDALIPPDTPYKSTNDHIKETKDRYNILVGELASGNTGRVVRDEMEKILREMWRLRQITHKAFKSRLLALKEYS